MSLIIDTSVILAILLNEPEKQKILLITAGQELIIPGSVHWEIGNALSALFKRNRVTIKQAKEVLMMYHQIPFRVVQPRLIDSLIVAERHKIYAYDAYILECAISLRFPLVTLDSQLSGIAKSIGLEIKEI